MARLTRVVVLGYPHHVTQRGNRRQQTFFEDADYQTYIELNPVRAKIRFRGSSSRRSRSSNLTTIAIAAMFIGVKGFESLSASHL